MALINCPECNKEISDKCVACPNCGYPLNEASETQQSNAVVNTVAETQVSFVNKAKDAVGKYVEQIKSSRKVQIITGCVAAGLVLFIIIIASSTANKQPESISLPYEGGISFVEDASSSAPLEYYIYPEDLQDKAKVKWSSSNNNVAYVDDGGYLISNICGKCTITITTSNGLSDSVVVEVNPAVPSLRDVYNKCDCDSMCCTLAFDGSYITVDTDPFDDKSGKYVNSACRAILLLNKELGFSDSLATKMDSTRLIDGRQEESNDNFEVSWAYSPSNGLEVIYTKK